MKRRMLKIFMVMVLGAVISLPGMAGAIPLFQGGPFTENGVNPFTNVNVGPFDKVEEFIVDSGAAWGQNWTGVLPTSWS